MNLHPASLVALALDGAPFDLPAPASLASLRVHAALAVPTQFELVFDDPTLDIADRFTPGTRVGIRVADGDLLTRGEVTACEYSYAPDRRHQLRVRGYDLLHRLRRRRPVRQHADVTVVTLARDLTADLDLTVDCSAQVPAWPFLIQSRQSDLELLVDLAARCGLYPSVRDDRLHLIGLDGLGPPVALKLGQELLEVGIEVNGEWASREVQVSGWNPLAVKEFTGRATQPQVGLAVEARVNPAQLGDDGLWGLVDEAVLGEAHAQALAQGELDSRSAHTVTARGVAVGDTRLRPGSVVDLSGIHPHVAGRFVLTEVHHVVDARRGFLTELTSVPPARRPRPTGTTLTLGVVTSVDDPDRLGRVQVRLPAVDDVETDWMGVLSLGAGKHKGLTILPDVGDTVVVLLGREDPARGVVLGGLYGADGSPDAGVEDGGVRRFSLVTAGGHRLQFDDQADSIRLEHDNGSFLELGADAVVLHAARDLLVEAPGQSVKIRGATVDFERK